MSTYISASRGASGQLPPGGPARFPTGQAPPKGGAARFPAGPGWVVHLPIVVADQAAAVSLAEEMAAWLACVPQIDAGAVEVSAEDEQSRRIRVLCQRRIGGGRRCWLPRGHEGTCKDGQRRPRQRAHNDVAARWVNAIDH